MSNLEYLYQEKENLNNEIENIEMQLTNLRNAKNILESRKSYVFKRLELVENDLQNQKQIEQHYYNIKIVKKPDKIIIKRKIKKGIKKCKI